jgi:hypothetical protein
MQTGQLDETSGLSQFDAERLPKASCPAINSRAQTDYFMKKSVGPRCV